jgi:hypothetical protein
MTWEITVSQNGKVKDSVEFEGERDGAINAMIDLYSKWFDQDYFPNDDLTEIKDCDGEVVWEKGDANIGIGFNGKEAAISLIEE